MKEIIPYPRLFDYERPDSNSLPYQVNGYELESFDLDRKAYDQSEIQTAIQEVNDANANYRETGIINLGKLSFFEQERVYKSQKKKFISNYLGRIALGGIAFCSTGYVTYESYEFITDTDISVENTTPTEHRENKSLHYYDDEGNIHLVSANN